MNFSELNTLRSLAARCHCAQKVSGNIEMLTVKPHALPCTWRSEGLGEESSPAKKGEH